MFDTVLLKICTICLFCWVKRCVCRALRGWNSSVWSCLSLIPRTGSSLYLHPDTAESIGIAYTPDVRLQAWAGCSARALTGSAPQDWCWVIWRPFPGHAGPARNKVLIDYVILRVNKAKACWNSTSWSRRCLSDGSMLCQRLRRCHNIEQSLRSGLVLAASGAFIYWVWGTSDRATRPTTLIGTVCPSLPVIFSSTRVLETTLVKLHFAITLQKWCL